MEIITNLLKNRVVLVNTKIIMIFIILVLINIISSQIFFRQDLTDSQLYTLSTSTKQILQGMDDVIFINIYFSRELPVSLVNMKKQVADILNEYQIYSHDKIKFQFADPADDEQTTNKVQKIGIPQIQMSIIEKDKREIKMGYLGLGIFYEDRTAVIPVIKDTTNLEYDLTNIILKITQKKTTDVAYLTGSSEKNLNKEYHEINEEISRQYRVEEININKGQTIPDSCTALIVAGPANVSEQEKRAIDQFIMEGKKAIFLIDTIKVDSLTASTKNSDIVDLLANYGVSVNTDIVLDNSNANVAFNTGFITFSIPYPLWPKLQSTNFDKSTPITSRLDSIVIPWGSSLESRPVNTVSFLPLIWTSDKSWIMSSPFDLNPQQYFHYENQGKHTMGAILTGRFHSYYRGRSYQPYLSPTTNIIVVSDSDFLSDDMIKRFAGNKNLFMNALDYFVIGNNLINIRNKNIKDKPIVEISNKYKISIKFLATIAGTLIIILVDLTRFYLRKKHKKTIAQFTINKESAT